MSPPAEVDAAIIDAIVCKVKSEGLFDQFRRECLADVDTKPAFQNVQQRVDAAVNAFLDGVEWKSQLNKNQLREKLRRSIGNDASFEAGIQRIVDQVVNPKLNSNLVPKIQDVAYKFLGIERPLTTINFDVKMETDGELPLELEQVDSPESDKSMALNTSADDEMHRHIVDKFDDLESPAFELACAADVQMKVEFNERQDDDMDISDGDDVPLQMNGSTLIQNDEAKSNLSSISGLTSSDSQNGFTTGTEQFQKDGVWDMPKKIENDDLLPSQLPLSTCSTSELSVESVPSLPPQSANIAGADVSIENISQDSTLSQVSSTSHLSIITNNFVDTRIDDSDSNHAEIDTSNQGINERNVCPYGISEEAQMQKFTDSSSSNNSLIIDTDNVSNGTNKFGNKNSDCMTRFDIKHQEIKFEGTSRKSIDVSESNDNNMRHGADDILRTHGMSKSNKNEQASKYNAPNHDKTESSESEFRDESCSDMVSCDAKSSNNLDNEDSKLAYDSSSSNHRQLKELDRDRETSSCSRDRSDANHHRHRSKDRSHRASSSKDRRRDKDRDRKSPTSKETSKCVFDESECVNSSKHRDSVSNSSKHTSSKHDDHNRSNHQKSSSRRKSKSDKHSTSNSTSSNSYSTNKREHSRHSSSSNSKDKDISKRDGKQVDSKRHRIDSTKSSSSKKDDHYTHKEKSVSRQRSRSKDSNDGNHRVSQPNDGAHARSCRSADQTESTEKADAGSSTKETQPITSHATSESSTTNTDVDTPTQAHIDIATENKSDIDQSQTLTPSQMDQDPDQDFVMGTRPVCVDQILTGQELNLELFIDENRNDPVVSSIEQSLEPAIRKPKVAANIFEARKLAKMRKEMDLNEQKKVEKATVLAKKYIRSNASGLRDDSSQGIELEFVSTQSSMGEGKTIGPTISSPIKYINGVNLPESKLSIITQVTAPSMCDNRPQQYPEQSVESSSTAAHSSDDGDDFDDDDDDDDDDDNDMDSFYGFDTNDIEVRKQLLSTINDKSNKIAFNVEAKATSKQLSNLIDAYGEEEILEMLEHDERLLFLENNKMSKDRITPSKLLNRKRKAGTTPANNLTEHNTPNDMLVANVLISQRNGECVVKPDRSAQPDSLSALAKQRQKTRYSNEDLFKPRPTLSSGSRSRRRGFNCNE